MSGRQTHNYIIEAMLDQECLRGRNAQTGRCVLLQRLPDLSAETAAALVAELSQLTLLDLPGIVKVHGFHSEDRGLWVITDQLAAPALSDHLRSRPLEVSDAVALLMGLLPGLAEVHASRLVHRDINPARIRMTEHGPLLTGFGVALTEGRSVYHMAPELWSNRVHPSPASDVYALGVTLYESLTGALPFPRGLPRSAYASLHARQGIPHVRERRPETPAWLADAIHTATRIKPQERFGTASEMLQAIEAARAVSESQAAAAPSAESAPAPAAAPAPAPAPAAAPAPGADSAPVDSTAPTPDGIPTKKGGRWAVLGCAILPLLAVGGIGLIAGSWWASQQPGGMAGLMHRGPLLLADNPSEQRITLSCISGPQESRSAAVLEPGEQQALLLSGVPVSCTAFNDARETLVNWGTDALPAEGDAWAMSVGSLDDTGVIEPSPEDEAEDTGLVFAEGIVEAVEDPQPAPVQRRRRPVRSEPEAEEGPGMVTVTIRADSSWRRWSRRVEIYVDDLSVGIAPLEIGMEPGVHTIRWFRESRVDHTCTVEIGTEGRTVGIDPAEPQCP